MLLESAASDAGDDLIARPLFGRPVAHAECMKMLQASNFVPCGSIILGKFCLNDDLRVELIRNYKVWGLVEALDAFSPFCFAEAYAVQVQNVLKGCFKNIPDEFTDRIAVVTCARMRSPVTPFICRGVSDSSRILRSIVRAAPWLLDDRFI